MGTNDASPDCPECGEPIGARASYCMHCGAEFGDQGPDQGGEDGGGIGDTIDSVIDSIDGSSDQPPDVEYEPAEMGQETSQDPVSEPETADSGFDTSTADASTTDASTGDSGDTTGGIDVSTVGTSGADASNAAANTGSGANAGTGTTDAGPDLTGPDDAGGEKGFMHPDSLLDNTLTGVVGIGTGIVIGLVSLFVFGIAFGGTGVLLAFVAWLGSTAYLARRRTVFDAVRDGAYGLAVVLGIAGLGVAVAAIQDPETGIAGAVGGLIPFLIFGSMVAGVGFLVGLKGVE